MIEMSLQELLLVRSLTLLNAGLFFMALTNQPYIPLYVQDWLSNNKLKFCSIGSHGLMINIMCVLHKENEYGTILLKQKYQQNTSKVKNFASMFAKLLPFEFAEIEPCLNELLDEKVLSIVDNKLICTRMVNDAILSETRAIAGRKRGKGSKDFAPAKLPANTEDEYVIEIIEYLNKKIGSSYSYHARNIQQLVMDRMDEKFTVKDFKKVIDNKCSEWLNTGMAKYLRPETLFSAEHFDSYLQPPKVEKYSPIV